jgi:raffinose/stachyose/melibiose transport system substrate-binding protein
MAICDQVRAYAKEHGLNLAPLANSRTTHFTLTNEIVCNLTTQLAERLDFRHRLQLDPEDVGRAYLRGEWNYDAPEVTAAFTELREVGMVSTPGFQQRERDSALTDFVSLRAVMVVAPAWEASSLKVICPFPLGAFRFPYPQQDDPAYGRFAKGPFGEGQVMTGMPFYLNRHTAHRAEALDFLRFMSSQEGSAIFTNVSNWLPIVIGVKPSEFSAQFQIQPNGYNWYGGVLGPSSHIDPQYFILNSLHTLWRTDGSVAAFAQTLNDGMPGKVRDNYRHDVIIWRDNIRREDAAGAAHVELALVGARPETLPLVTLANEISLYQHRVVLAQP